MLNKITNYPETVRLAQGTPALIKVLKKNKQGKLYSFVTTYYGDSPLGAVYCNLSPKYISFTPKVEDILKVDIIKKGDKKYCINVYRISKKVIISAEQWDAVKNIIKKYHKEEKIERQIQLLEDAFKRFPFNKYIIMFLINTYFNNYNYDKIEELIKIGEKYFPFEPHLLALAGKYCFAKDNYQKAIEYFRRCLMFKPNDLKAITLMGKVYLQIGKFNEAEECFLEVIKRKADDTFAVSLLEDIREKKID